MLESLRPPGKALYGRDEGNPGWAWVSRGSPGSRPRQPPDRDPNMPDTWVASSMTTRATPDRYPFPVPLRPAASSHHSSRPPQEAVTLALRHSRGRYDNARASQLAGIPSSTLYEWRRNEVYVPDFNVERPAAWSYRDLIYLRLMAFLRQGGMERHTAARQVKRLKREVERGADVEYIYASKKTLVVDAERTSRTTGESLLPFETLSELFRIFSLHEPIKELIGERQLRLWAPDLVRPSEHTFISPWIMAGDPCVVDTRIPTASIFALRTERGLSNRQIVALYKDDLTQETAEEAFVLESQLRGLAEAA